MRTLSFIIVGAMLAVLPVSAFAGTKDPREAWKHMTPEQRHKAVIASEKAQQERRDQWKKLTPEEQEKAKADMKKKWQRYNVNHKDKPIAE